MDYKKIFNELFSITSRAVFELKEYCENEKDLPKVRILTSIKQNLDQISEIHKKRDFELDNSKQKFEELYSEIRRQNELIENLKKAEQLKQLSNDSNAQIMFHILSTNPQIVEKTSKEQLETLLGKEKTAQLKNVKYNPYKRVA